MCDWSKLKCYNALIAVTGSLLNTIKVIFEGYPIEACALDYKEYIWISEAQKYFSGNWGHIRMTMAQIWVIESLNQNWNEDNCTEVLVLCMKLKVNAWATSLVNEWILVQLSDTIIRRSVKKLVVLLPVEKKTGVGSGSLSLYFCKLILFYSFSISFSSTHVNIFVYLLSVMGKTSKRMGSFTRKHGFSWFI